MIPALDDDGKKRIESHAKMHYDRLARDLRLHPRPTETIADALIWKEKLDDAPFGGTLAQQHEARVARETLEWLLINLSEIRYLPLDNTGPNASPLLVVASLGQPEALLVGGGAQGDGGMLFPTSRGVHLFEPKLLITPGMPVRVAPSQEGEAVLLAIPLTPRDTLRWWVHHATYARAPKVEP
jgi:hypothetical protein